MYIVCSVFGFTRLDFVLENFCWRPMDQVAVGVYTIDHQRPPSPYEAQGIVGNFLRSSRFNLKFPYDVAYVITEMRA